MGEPVRDYEFTIRQVDPSKMLRADLLSSEPPLADDQPIREVTWERRHTFITVWYRGTGPQALGFNGVQWDKRIDTWAEPMSTRPPATQGAATLTASSQQANARPLVAAPPQGWKSVQDQDEANEVLEFVRAHCPHTPQPTLYCSGGRNATHVHVYGVIRPADQDKIIESVRAEFPRRRWKQVYLLFRDRERFAPRANGWQERDGECDLCSVLIK